MNSKDEKLFKKCVKLTEKLNKRYDQEIARKWGECAREIILILRARNSH